MCDLKSRLFYYCIACKWSAEYRRVQDKMTIEELPTTYISGYHNEEKCKKMDYKELGHTGMKVSRLGIGCSAFGGCFGTADETECYDILEDMIKSGINYIDTAPWYGNAEEVLGRGLKQKNIPRKSYYIATKVGRYDPDVRKMFDFSAARVTRSIDESLEKLGVQYIDVIQIHDIEFAPSIDIILNETLPALQKAREDGKIRFIGITGYPLNILKEVLERSTVKIDTVLSYCHYSLNDSSLTEYLPYFKSKGVGMINASPNSMGLLTSNGPPDWHPASQEVKNACREAAKYAEEQSVNIARLALYFSCDHHDIDTTMVSACKREYMATNLDVILNGISFHEKQVLDEIRTRFFSNLKKKGWEGIEVERYRKELSQINITDPA